MAAPDFISDDEMAKMAPDFIPDEPAGRPSRYPQPRSMTATDADLGIESPPDFGKDMLGRQRTAPAPYPIRSGDDMFPGGAGRPMDSLEGDPAAQGVVLSATMGPLARAAYASLAPRIGSLAAGASTGAAEGALGAKSSGANIGPAAALGALFGSAGVVGAPGSPSAVARNNAQMAKDVTKGATKAPAKLANDVRFRSDAMGDVLSELPETRKAMVTQARSNPGAAGKAVKNTVRDLTAENDAVFDAIQAQHGGVPLDGMVQRLTSLEDKLTGQGHGVAADAAARFRDDLVKRYGANGPGAKLSSEQIRNIRNDIGDIAFPGGGAKPGASRAAQSDIYGEVNEAIEEVANMTDGVDANAFKARNRQISTLLPSQKALGSRAASEADREMSLVGRAKGAVTGAATRLNRGLRYGAEKSGGDNTGLMLSPAAMAAQYLLNGGNQ